MRSKSIPELDNSEAATPDEAVPPFYKLENLGKKEIDWKNDGERVHDTGERIEMETRKPEEIKEENEYEQIISGR